MSGDVVLRARNLVKHYPQVRGPLGRRSGHQLRAVTRVDLQLRKGETLGIVGESGCGKSTLARMLSLVERPTSGRIDMLGEAVFDKATTRLRGRRLRDVRRHVQMVFQDPYTSLNPRMTVGQIVGEPYAIHRDLAGNGDRRRLVAELLELVGLNPRHASRYPHEFSGGQRQRIGIARALAVRPEILICDEAVSALDVSVRAQIMNLLVRLQDELGLAYVFIAHDLSLVRHVADRVMVMYLGQVMELGTSSQVYDGPSHPYTRALLSAAPNPDPAGDRGDGRIILQGDVPSPVDAPSGCRFRTRCWMAQDRCAVDVPLLEVRSPADHPSACHFVDQLANDRTA